MEVLETPTSSLQVKRTTSCATLAYFGVASGIGILISINTNMKYSTILETPLVLDIYQPKDLVNLSCNQCNKNFLRSKSEILKNIKKKNKHVFCSNLCRSLSLKTNQKVSCKQCNKKFLKLPNQIKKSPNHFCSKSCAAIYNNAHKTHGTRVSKLELWLQEQLIQLYPDLEFHFNRKDAIMSELDIFIPSLKLAFEINGIFHYEPIFGKDKLNKTKNNDKRKFAACYEADISFCIIDSSQQNQFTPESSQKYLNIITNIINSKF